MTCGFTLPRRFHRRNRLNWLYDNDLQQFTTPSGQVVTLLQIAQLLQDQVNGCQDLSGAWSGWRIRQNRLIAPGESFKTSRITASNIRAFSRWLTSFQGEQAQLEFHSATPDHPRQPPATNSHGFADTQNHERNERHPLSQTAEVIPRQESTREQPREQPPYEPRRRAQVIQLADYRARLLAQ